MQTVSQREFPLLGPGHAVRLRCMEQAVERAVEAMGPFFDITRPTWNWVLEDQIGMSVWSMFLEVPWGSLGGKS